MFWSFISTGTLGQIFLLEPVQHELTLFLSCHFAYAPVVYMYVPESIWNVSWSNLISGELLSIHVLSSIGGRLHIWGPRELTDTSLGHSFWCENIVSSIWNYCMIFCSCSCLTVWNKNQQNWGIIKLLLIIATDLTNVKITDFIFLLRVHFCQQST